MSHHAAEQEARHKEQKYTYRREALTAVDFKAAWAQARNDYFKESENRLLRQLMYGTSEAKEPARITDPGPVSPLKINKIAELVMNPLFHGVSPYGQLSKHGVKGDSFLTGNEEIIHVRVTNIADGGPTVKMWVDEARSFDESWDEDYEVCVPVDDDENDVYVDVRVLLT